MPRPSDPHETFAGLVAVSVVATLVFAWVVIVSPDHRFRSGDLFAFFQYGDSSRMIAVGICALAAYVMSFASIKGGGGLALIMFVVAAIVFSITWLVGTRALPNPLETERRLFVISDCDRQMELAVNYYFGDNTSDQKSDGWWQIDPHSRRYLKSSNGGKLWVRGDNLWYHARSVPDGAFVLGTDSWSEFKVNGEKVTADTAGWPISKENKIYELRITCGGELAIR